MSTVTVTPTNVTGPVTTTTTPEPKVEQTAPKVELPTPETKPAVDPRFEQLARREKQLRMQTKQFQQERSAWEAERQRPQVPDTSWKDNIKKDLVGTLAEAGLTYDDVINTFVNHTPLDHNQRMMQAKLQQMEEAQNKILNDMNEQQNQNYSQAIKQIRTEVKKIIKTNPDEYEVINSQGPIAEQAVVKLIEETYKKDGYLMDVEEATRDVEDYFVEQAKTLTKLKKLQAQAPQAQAPTKPQPQVQQRGAQTLSNTMQVTTRPPNSEKERKARAIAAFERNKALNNQGQ